MAPTAQTTTGALGQPLRKRSATHEAGDVGLA